MMMIVGNLEFRCASCSHLNLVSLWVVGRPASDSSSELEHECEEK